MVSRRRMGVAAAKVVLGVVLGKLGVAHAQVPREQRQLVLASTTSTDQSGLFAHLLPRFKQATGIAVRVVAVGSGQALDIARRGDADAVLTHDPEAEQRFVHEGFASERRAVMHNDFVLLGPPADPHGVAGNAIVQALRKLDGSAAAFISRGDASGTHALEQRLWAEAGVPRERLPRGFRECGCGMGQALNMAAAVPGMAYVLADRATWLAHASRTSLPVLVQGDARLFNPYSAMVVSRQRHPHVRHEAATAWADWLTSAAGKAAINEFRVQGQQVFFAAPGGAAAARSTRADVAAPAQRGLNGA